MPAVWAELASVEPARRCCRIAERAGLGAEARGRAGTPAIGRLAVRLEGSVDAGEFSWERAAAHCRAAYMRGMLLAHGSLSITATGTHLELVVPASDIAAEKGRASALGFPCGARLRRGRGVLTWKDAEGVIGLLRRVGASASTLELETRLVGRSLSGQMNRAFNAEGANLRRAVEAAHRQLEHIESLERSHGLRHLSRQARRVVDARRKAPEATFGELAAQIGLSRQQVQRAFYEVESAVLHRQDGA